MPSPDKFIVACPGCQAKFKVPASLAGRTTDCPRCKHPIAIPASLGEETGTAAGLPVPVPSEEGRSRPIARRPELDDDDDDRDVRRRSRRDDDEDDDDDDRGRRRRRLEPHRGTTILILGIVSLFFAPIILGPIAWYMGNEDLRKMREGRMDKEGQQNTQTGRVIGMISTILFIVAMLSCCLFMTVMIALSPKK